MTNTIEMFALSQVSPATSVVYGFQVRAFADWLKRECRVKPERATTAHILAYKQSLSDRAPATQARVIATVRAFYRWLKDAGQIKTDPAAVVRPPRAIRDKAPTYITTDETRRLLSVVDPAARHAQRDTAILYALAQGLRVAEVCALDIGDVLQPKGDGLPALRVRGKDSKARSVPIGAAAYNTIIEVIAQRGKVEKHDPLFVCQSAGEGPKRLTPRAIRWLFGKYSERAGLDAEKRHPHAARHGFATRLLFETSTPGGLFVVSKLLGHSSLTTTQIYLHADRRALDQAVIGDPLNTAA